MEIKDRIRYHRRKLKLSQEELAERLNVSRQTVYKWESGSSLPDSNNLMALCIELSIPISELIEAKNDELSKPIEGFKRRKSIIVFLLLFLLIGLVVHKYNFNREMRLLNKYINLSERTPIKVNIEYDLLNNTDFA